MKRFLTILMLTASVMSVAVSEAEAKRMGGGSSFGRQSQGISRQAPAQQPNQAANPSQAQQAAPASVPQKPASPWRNILGGALLGLGLGALLSHFGLGGAAASIIGALLTIGLVIVAVMLLMRLFRGKNAARHEPAFAGASHPAQRTPDIGSRLEQQPNRPAAFQSEPSSGAIAASAPNGVPADFDTPSFLRHAKTYFIRLQAAWDKADINDIREFTSPEMFGELRLQLQERGVSSNVTDVMSLEAELLGIEKTANDHLASVRFTGMIKEDENAPAAPFAEIWNLSKPLSGQGGWVLAGLQQLS